MADSQIDTNRLIDALMARWSSEGMNTERLRQTTQKMISTMPEIWRFRVGKLMDKILPIETLHLIEDRIKTGFNTPEDPEILASHYEALGEYQTLITEYMRHIAETQGIGK
jgi:hypothetical protein